MDLACGLTPCAHRLPPRRGQVIESGFTEDRAARITGAKKKDVHDSVVLEVEKAGGSTASEHGEAARMSAHRSGWPEQHSAVR